MKVSDFMAAVTRNASATGEIPADRMLLAVDCSATGDGDVGDYDIAFVHVENVGASLSPKTTDKNYLYEGASTLKTDTQRTFNVTGQRYLGDGFQDFVCGHSIKFGVGGDVQRNYAYFNIDSGAGESGKVTIVTKKDGAAASGNPTDIEVDLLVAGTPAEYTYAEPAQVTQGEG